MDAPAPLPGTAAKHRTLAFWLNRLDREYDLDEPLLAAEDIDALNASLRARGTAAGLQALETLSASELRAQVNERLAWLQVRLESGALRDATDRKLPPTVRARFRSRRTLPRRLDQLRVALAPVTIRCGPWLDSLHKRPPRHELDRNSCSAVRPQQAVQVLSRWPGDLLLVRTSYTLGWIPRTAPLSRPLSDVERARWLDPGRYEPDRAITLVAQNGTGLRVVPGMRLPALPGGRVLFASDRGIHTADAADLRPSRRPLTRRAFLETAFSYLDEPYGWGGEDGGLDCSRYVMEVLASFGIALPRTSGRQAFAGTFSIDLRSVRDERRRRDLLVRAADHGVVLLHLPGHVMLYIGRDEAGRHRVIHSLAEYAEPCCPECEGAAGEVDIRLRVGRVCVSGLELGRGSSRLALIERLDRITVIGFPPDPELLGVAELRPPAPLGVPRSCPRDLSGGPAMLISPRQPDSSRPLRAVVSAGEHPGPTEIALYRQGERVDAELERFGGPPFGTVATIERPRPGRWTAVFGEGSDVRACRTFVVRDTPPAVPETSGDLSWEVRRSWNKHTENLYATFVESLFRYPADQAPTWSGLTPLLRDPHRNLLHDHQAPGADGELKLHPDCADLPYFLRAYFAWNLGLPFGFRECTRARDGRAARCKGLRGHYAYLHGKRPAHTFRHYLHQLKGRVHSSNVRTRPAAEESDFYPVVLRRESLRPGVVFADPYGHTLVITRWIPQTATRSGRLIAADAQPDGTVGLRRFWRGSFLWSAAGARLGAGWKMHRPAVYDEDAEDSFSVLDNSTLSKYLVPFGDQQSRLEADAFYRRMSGFINPLPLDPERRLVTLVSALHESVRRRVRAVSVGETFRAEHGRSIRMPSGVDIFQSTGDWERYSTPSRDLRLLTAIDVVTTFPARVAAAPARYGLRGSTRKGRLSRLWKQLERELRRRSIRYVRSDGTRQRLSLYQIVGRQRFLEMGYNPNDCVEIRWGAPPNSAERASCKHRAPEEQRTRMESFRAWFRTRSRPPR